MVFYFVSASFLGTPYDKYAFCQNFIIEGFVVHYLPACFFSLLVFYILIYAIDLVIILTLFKEKMKVFLDVSNQM